MMNRLLVAFVIISSFLGDAMKLDNGPPKLKKARRYELPPPIEKSVEVVGKVLTQNPISRVITNVYDFFYWLPRRNLLWDVPTVFWRNSTVDYIRWYQVPHNLPPYRYLDRDNEFMKDFFCYGLPGSTLPLGDWDPFGFNLVSKKLVLKYRESEIKHGRLAMLASCGMLIQESFHPLHPYIGGLAITHMDQLANEIDLQSNILTKWIAMVDMNTLGISNLLEGLPQIPIDYFAVILFLMSFELKALYRNWDRWLPNEYNHPFDHNIGIGNLQETYENGNYGFDFLKLVPEDPDEKRDMIEKELNHGRLAMIAAVGMIGQEYLTGYPMLESLSIFINSLIADNNNSPF